MRSFVENPGRRVLLALSFLMLGAGAARADGSCPRFWCHADVCCLMTDEGNLCFPKQCHHYCIGLEGWQWPSTVAAVCGS